MFDKYALSRIGKESVYSYFVTDKALGWVVAFATLGIQVAILVLFVMASEPNLQKDTIDIQFTWKCPRDSDSCRDTADLNGIGWFIFCMLMIAHLAKDSINGSKLIYHSSRIRHSRGSRIRYFIGGIGLCSITLFAIYVSCFDDVFHYHCCSCMLLAKIHMSRFNYFFASFRLVPCTTRQSPQAILISL